MSGVIIALYLLLGMIFLVSLFNTLTAPLVRNGPQPRRTPRVSLLVPARDEERTIARSLESLRGQEYPDLEIIVLDDHSRDRTAAMVRDQAALDPRIRLLQGEALPPGWTGKNWACHQLSRAASGEILLFTDADNFHAPFAVARSVGWIEKLDLDLFSAFPQQITMSWAEKLVVPIFDLFVYSLLPLWLTLYSHFPSLSAANGQWLAFTRRGYAQSGGHAAVRSHIVEDTALSRRAKQLGLRTLTASGRDAVFGRMYTSPAEVGLGFAKNAFGLMNFKAIPYFLFMGLLFFIFVLPYLLLLFPTLRMWALPAVGVNILLRLLVAVRFGQPLVYSVILHPLSILATILVGLASFYYYLKGDISWKGRAVRLRGAAEKEGERHA
ncbi:MAG TPA: glycosyltransferase family 2 protein [bacterium]|nr:glycosyltransferase family 2 protein [bacterium]HPR87419.1 glycosyltransferase family 2 protein [bacterium]